MGCGFGQTITLWGESRTGPSSGMQAIITQIQPLRLKRMVALMLRSLALRTLAITSMATSYGAMVKSGIEAQLDSRSLLRSLESPQMMVKLAGVYIEVYSSAHADI